MSFFRSGSNTPQPGGQQPYARVPPEGGYRDQVPPARPHRVPPRYDDGAQYEKRGYDRHAPASRGRYVATILVRGVRDKRICSYGVASAPSDALALSNCLIVHPSDFQQGQHVLVKQQFPLTTRYASVLLPRSLQGAQSVGQANWSHPHSLDTITLASFRLALSVPPPPSGNGSDCRSLATK